MSLRSCALHTSCPDTCPGRFPFLRRLAEGEALLPVPSDAARRLYGAAAPETQAPLPAPPQPDPIPIEDVYAFEKRAEAPRIEQSRVQALLAQHDDLPLEVRELVPQLLPVLDQHGPCAIEVFARHLPPPQVNLVGQALRALHDMGLVGIFGCEGSPLLYWHRDQVPAQKLLPALIRLIPARSHYYRSVAIEAALDAGLVLMRAPRGVALCHPQSGAPYAVAPRLLELGLHLLEWGGEPVAELTVGEPQTPPAPGGTG